MTAFPVRDRFVGLVNKTDIELVRREGCDRGKTDGRISEQGQANAECLVARP